jgi:hypothetical protein
MGGAMSFSGSLKPRSKRIEGVSKKNDLPVCRQFARNGVQGLVLEVHHHQGLTLPTPFLALRLMCLYHFPVGEKHIIKVIGWSFWLLR